MMVEGGLLAETENVLAGMKASKFMVSRIQKRLSTKNRVN